MLLSLLVRINIEVSIFKILKLDYVLTVAFRERMLIQKMPVKLV